MKTINATMLALGLITLVTGSIQAVRHISAEDMNIIPGAMYYMVHGKSHCEKNIYNPLAATFKQSMGYSCLNPKECPDHALINDLFKKYQHPDAKVVTYQDRNRTTIAIVDVGPDSAYNPMQHLDVKAKAQAERATIYRHPKLGVAYISFYDVFEKLIMALPYQGTEAFNDEDRKSFLGFVDFSNKFTYKNEILFQRNLKKFLGSRKK